MRAIAASLMVLTLCLPAAALECRVPPPMDKRQPPSVPYYEMSYPPEKMAEACGAPMFPAGLIGACTGPEQSLDVEGGWIWVIRYREDFTDDQYECAMLHEKAHMPPNNWDHGPTWRSYNSAGKWRPAPAGPQWRRPVHVKRIFFARAAGEQVPY